MTTTPQAALLSEALEKIGDFFHAHEAWQLARIDDGRIQLHLTDDQYEAIRRAVADKLKPRSSTLTNDELIDLAVEHGLGRTLTPLGLNTGNVFYTDNSYRTAALFDFADAHEAAILAKLQATQEPAQAGELPEPDAVFYCSEDTGYLTQYLRPPANLTDGDVAMYEADTVRSLLISAALSARKPLSVERIHQIGEALADGSYGPVGGPMECYQFEPDSLVEFVRAIESGSINGLEVKP